MSLQEERHDLTCSGIWCETRKNIKKKKNQRWNVYKWVWNEVI
jgi:hypothetical protein